jgi:uncharacterized protein (TIGR04255 family)
MIMKIKKSVRYKKPPLIQAQCEFRFQKTEMIPHIVIGRFYEKIEPEFPTVETLKGIEVQTIDESSSPTLFMEEKTQFANKGKTKFIQIGSNTLIISQLKPYEDYSSFRAYIEQILRLYRETAKPKDIQQIDLRYTNRIDIKEDQDLDDVFEIGFTIPNVFKKFPDPYLLRMEFNYHKDRDKLIIVLSNMPQEKKSQKSIKLEFEYSLLKPDEIDNMLLSWLDEAHSEIEKAFHACLTESFKKTFEPE